MANMNRRRPPQNQKPIAYEKLVKHTNEKQPTVYKIESQFWTKDTCCFHTQPLTHRTHPHTKRHTVFLLPIFCVADHCSKVVILAVHFVQIRSLYASPWLHLFVFFFFCYHQIRFSLATLPSATIYIISVGVFLLHFGCRQTRNTEKSRSKMVVSLLRKWFQ